MTQVNRNGTIKFELINNVKAAKQLGLTIPLNVEVRATEVIR